MDEPKSEKSEDVALLCAAADDGESLGVLRKRNGRVEAALMRKARDGQPIQGELVRLLPREEPLLYDVDVIHEAPAVARDRGAEDRGAHSGATNDAYRKGWDRLFAKKRNTKAN